jgi:iron complex outermembrane receptor protein
MNTQKLAFLATTALVGNLFVAGSAFAQSTASSAVETIVVTGNSGPADVGGILQAETVAKSRTTIDQEFIDTQVAGQTILQTLSVVTPGLNFTNNDPYGTSGGNLRLHGFDGNRVALTFDGMPLNDTGNYATYSNQILDSELIAAAQVNTGSTDVDSPTAASTGGTINFSSLTPSTDPHAWAKVSLGDFEYQRYMAFAETGEFGPWGTRAWGAYSYQTYDKFKGEGELEKQQFNAKIYQPLGGGNDFVSIAAHFNRNRNNNYFGANLQTLNADGSINQQSDIIASPRGYEFDFNSTYLPITSRTRAGFAGDIDEDPSANSNYFGIRINPSDTGNIRGQSRFDFGDSFTLTVDPSFQYTLANGGTQNILVAESCNGSLGTTAANATNTAANCPALTRQLLGVAPIATSGVDLNADGDFNDNVRLMNPSNTNTRRYGLLSSLIWRLNDDHLLRAGYTFDYGRHRQTGEFGYINNNNGAPRYADVFGGKDGNGRKVMTADGSFLRNRDRFSIAQLNQASLEYRGQFLNDDLNVNVGVRAPFFERELNQYCYSQNGTSFVRCTTETPASTLANGNVTFAGSTTTQFIAPYTKTLKYDDILPNVGASYRFGDSQIFGSYAESTSLPRTDNLYTVIRRPDGSIANSTVEPETSKTLEGGYRYDNAGLIGSVNLWRTDFENRIVQSFDQDLGISIDRNVGKVEQWGVDAGVGYQPFEEILMYLSASYNDSEVQDDIRLSGTDTGIARTKGKKLAETPEWTWSSRVEYEPVTWFTFGAQVKYVGERFVTDVNDLSVPGYVVTDLDATFRLALFGLEDTSIQVNVINLFDKDYFGSLSTTTSATVGGPGFSRPFANVGAPRTVTASLKVGF